MKTWQRHVRLALAMFVVLFAATLFFALRRQPPPPQTAPVKRADPTAALESSRGVAIQFKGDKEQLKVEFEDTLIYADGTRRLKGIKVTVAERAGRSFVLTGREGEVGTDDSTVRVTGDVALATSDGLTVQTAEALYTKSDGIVRAPGPAQFRRGRLTGASTGFSYDGHADELALLDQVAAQIAPNETGEGGAHITAGAAVLTRPAHQWRFSGGVRVVREGRALESDRAIAHLSEDDARVERIELSGGSRIVGDSGAPGSLDAMSAREMDLTYGSDGERLQRAILTGSAVVQLVGARGSRGRRIAAERMSIGLAPDGATVTSLSGRDHVRVDLPPEANVPGRVVQSTEIEASGGPATGITSVVFKERVEFRETPAGRSSPRVGTASVLTLAVKPGFGDVDSARFSGGTRFEDGDLTATARDAMYLVSADELVLSGPDERTARQPQVDDPKVTITGARIDVSLESRRIVAQGSVDSVLQPSAAPSGGVRAPGGKPSAPSPATSGHRPGLLSDDQPVYVTSDRLVYDGPAGLAVYTGQGHLWQGDTSVVGDRLTLDDSKGDLTATGSVRSSLVWYQTNEQTKARERVPSRGTAESMVYTDDTRRIAFQRGPARAATLSGAQGDLTGDRINVFLTAAGDEVDRLEADGNVILKLSAQRTGSGRRLVYTAADGRYVMLGAPVQVFEQLQEGCRITTGTTLTFFKSTDRIVADGNQERRTETKSGGTCAGPGFD
jgi:LPS export ABC transporter protein LptC/lipopolysaccharide transport protein LptA